jgi:hypothetical protein
MSITKFMLKFHNIKLSKDQTSGNSTSLLLPAGIQPEKLATQLEYHGICSSAYTLQSWQGVAC